MKTLKIAQGIFLATIILFAGCKEEEPAREDMNVNEIGKPIALDYNPEIENSLEDTYFGMRVAFYIPAGIEELKNRPMLFTLSTRRNRSVAGSLMQVIQEEGMIAVTPLEGNTVQFDNMLKAMIESDYINPDQVYVSGFSNGGMDIYSLAWSHQDKINGAILLDPSGFYAGEPTEGSKLSVCVVCQENRAGGYGMTSKELNAYGMRSKVISVPGIDHFGILSVLTKDQKKECFDFVKNMD